jgi:hydroxylamine reductase
VTAGTFPEPERIHMFCYQCEQTSKSVACTVKGVCGKEDEVASVQDALIYSLKGLALVIEQAAPLGIVPPDTYPFLAGSLFMTLTNVNFDSPALMERTAETVSRREALRTEMLELQPDLAFPEAAVAFFATGSVAELADQGRAHGINAEASTDPDIRSLQHAVLYGLKGVAAYCFHAAELGFYDAAVDEYLVEALVSLARFERGDLSEWIANTLRCGEANYKTMALLDRANTETFGIPIPTDVPLGAKAGKAILVSGHDLADLKALLEQTEGKGITVYTHGEMLPAHAYPELRAYPHLYGNFGGAWYSQKKDFPRFPGAVLMTSNCIQIPEDSYKADIFTRSVVGVSNATHLAGRHFAPVIERALALPGFPADEPGKTVKVGFMRGAVLAEADRIIGLVRAGKIRHFFLVGGCDGAKPGRDYYTRFVELTPPDTVVLTLACGKYRFYDRDLGTIDGLPRLLDMGQCNDAYSAVQVALALADAFGVGVNELPLSMIITWYEQKAVAVLLALLYLGIRDIRLGPSQPAFLTQNVRQYLADTFALKSITTPEEDLAAILGS